VFGERPAAVRFYGEAAWGKQFNGTTDAFGAAYPYFGGVQAMEVYGERVFTPGAGLAAVRVGRYRTPFGISSRGDHSYSGFLRAPLIRYDGYWALSNNFLEQGVDAVVGIPQLYRGSRSRDVLLTARTRADGMPMPSCIVHGWVR